MPTHNRIRRAIEKAAGRREEPRDAGPPQDQPRQAFANPTGRLPVQKEEQPAGSTPPERTPPQAIRLEGAEPRVQASIEQSLTQQQVNQADNRRLKVKNVFNAAPGQTAPAGPPPMLLYWTKKNIAGDQEAALKQFITDALRTCMPTPSGMENMNSGEAAKETMKTLDKDQGKIQEQCDKYGVNSSALGLAARLRLREDGELEVVNVGNPEAAKPLAVSDRGRRNNDIDYPANKELKDIITSDVWRSMTRSEKESAVEAINESLSDRRGHVDLMARLECGAMGGAGKAGGCFCNRPGCAHDRLPPSDYKRFKRMQEDPQIKANYDAIMGAGQPNASDIRLQADESGNRIEVRPREDYDEPRSAREKARPGLGAVSQIRPVKPAKAPATARKRTPSWYGPQPGKRRYVPA